LFYAPFTASLGEKATGFGNPPATIPECPMPRLLLALAVLGATLLPAAAQPQPDFGPRVPVLTDWTGLYVGLAGGAVTSNVEGISSLSALRTTTTANGWQFGALAGFNLQLGPIVLGVEGDLTLLKASAATQVVGGVVAADIDWLATLRGRIGVPVLNLLPYVTAGVAMSNVDMTFLTVGNDANVMRGWTAGAGLEAALVGGWRLRGEYLYARTDQARFTVPGGATWEAQSGIHTLRAAVVVRFGN